jgi:uncharacterized protein YdeI (YjbR/CyaY-like superfamily)
MSEAVYWGGRDPCAVRPSRDPRFTPMGKTNTRVDDYIAKSGEFAKPILMHFRKLVHRQCPEAEEEIKWGMPMFVHQGIVCSMAAFKQHVRLHFWKSRLVVGSSGAGAISRITSMEQLPSDAVLSGYILKAVELNKAGVKLPAKARPGNGAPRVLEIPDYFVAALAKSRAARANFEKFSYSHKKEYVEWLVEAKREETREKRLKQAIAQIAEGKGRNWKYEKC